MSNDYFGGNMGKGCAIVVMCLVFGAMAMNGLAFAHGTEMHGKAAMNDVQMKKLHAMMPMFSEVSAKLETALEKKNIVAVETEAGKLLKSVPDLKKSTPHKNITQRKKYVELATNLEIAINSTVSLAQKSDFAGAKAAFRNIENTCAACHAKFRD